MPAVAPPSPHSQAALNADALEAAAAVQVDQLDEEPSRSIADDTLAREDVEEEGGMKETSEDTGKDAPTPPAATDDLPPPPKKARLSAAPSRSSRRFSGLPAGPSSPSSSIRSRTTRAGPSDLQHDDSASLSGENEVVEESEERGKDGKRYLLSGIYWSTGLSPEGSVKRRAPLASAPTNWRLVTPSPTSLFPPPVFHAETLLDTDEDDEPRVFEPTYPIFRDFWFGEGGSRTAVDEEGKPESEVVKSVSREEDEATRKEIEKMELSKKPEPFKYLKMNAYGDRKPDKAAAPAICMCSPSSDCGADCINRLMQYCCEPKLCPTGENCTNVPLHRREGIPEGKHGLRVIWTGNRGFGLKTMVPIKKGQFVIEYRGEIITRDESYRRVLTTYQGKPSYYFLDYDGFEVLDAGQRGNSSRFINHSCGPNLGVVRWRLATMEEYQMGIFALHDIPAGTELTYDYGWQDFSSIAPRPTTAVAAPPVDAAPHASTSAAVIDTSVTPSTPSAASASFPALTLIATGSNPSPASPPSSPLSSLSGTPPPRPTKTIAPLSPLGAHVDPARQRCYCGAQECSGFLGGRKKATACGKKGAAGSSGAAGAGATNAKAPRKRARDAYALRMQDGGRKVEFAPPKTAPKVVFVQAKVQASASTSSQSVAERVEKRGTSAGAVAKRLAGKKGKEPAVLEQVMGAMRSGREAAKKALGKLMGAPAPVFEEEEQ